MNNYHKNFILCGEIDFFCLLCEESFEASSVVERHIRWETHRKNIKKQTYISKYKKDYIYKIQNNYYCEICNNVMKYEAVSNHIKDDDHKEHKINPQKAGKPRNVLIKRHGDGSIMFPKLTINKLKWHGINNRKCTLCQMDVNVGDGHVRSTLHMVNIIQSEVIENAGNYFRQIKDKYYCFICSNILCEHTLSDHSCKKEIHKNIKSPQTNTKESKLNTDLAGSIQVKSKSSSDNVMHLVDHGKLRSELAKYGKQNFIKLNEGGSKAYCLLCDIYLSAHICVVMAHVKGARHRGHLELKGLIPKQNHSEPEFKVESLATYMHHVFHSESFNVFCVNYTFAVDALSFMFVTPLENNPKQPKRKCFQCEKVLSVDTSEEVTEHWKNKEHKENFMASSVVLMKEEFIRIVRPDLFHCGFCNQVYPFWETMEKHLTTFGHKCAKKLNENLYTLAIKSFEEEQFHYELLSLALG